MHPQKTAHALRHNARAFSTRRFLRRDGEVIMNRYSRTVTQPKDQGASQVCSFALLFLAFEVAYVWLKQTSDDMRRRCCTLQME